jgi:hypothetical protein
MRARHPTLRSGSSKFPWIPLNARLVADSANNGPEPTVEQSDMSKRHLFERARQLRLQGKSLLKIAHSLGIAKSTASNWLRSWPLPAKPRRTTSPKSPPAVKAPRRYQDKNGYLRVLVDGKLVGEHRLVAASVLDRPLRGDEVVHHRNGVTWDNRPDNLQVLSAPEHAKHHARPQKMVQVTCAWCRSPFLRSESKVRYQMGVGAALHCSRRCVSLHVRAEQVKNGILTGRKRSAVHGTWGAYHRCGPPRCAACRALAAQATATKRAKLKAPVD